VIEKHFFFIYKNQIKSSQYFYVLPDSKKNYRYEDKEQEKHVIIPSLFF